jgi:hypothetical protein
MTIQHKYYIYVPNVSTVGNSEIVSGKFNLASISASVNYAQKYPLIL